VHRLPREVLRRRDRHRTSIEFRLGVIWRIHELFKRPSYTGISLENLKRKRPLGIYRQKWEDNRIDLKEVGWVRVSWMNLALVRVKWRALVYIVMKLRVS
jgi:hypothetical protein